MRIFFGGPLTNLSDADQTKQFYTRLGDIATKCGWDYYWAWQRGTDPEENPDVTPARVYQIDTYELEKSDVMVAIMNEPSTGTGIEIEYARHFKIPVVLMYKKGTKVSRMLRGCPSIHKELVYETEDEACTLLTEFITTHKPAAD